MSFCCPRFCGFFGASLSFSFSYGPPFHAPQPLLHGREERKERGREKREREERRERDSRMVRDLKGHTSSEYMLSLSLLMHPLRKNQPSSSVSLSRLSPYSSLPSIAFSSPAYGKQREREKENKTVNSCCSGFFAATAAAASTLSLAFRKFSSCAPLREQRVYKSASVGN